MQQAWTVLAMKNGAQVTIKHPTRIPMVLTAFTSRMWQRDGVAGLMEELIRSLSRICRVCEYAIFRITL